VLDTARQWQGPTNWIGSESSNIADRKMGRGKQCEEPLIHTDSTLIFENWEEDSHKKAQKATKKNNAFLPLLIFVP
ncbi:MAG: hypothetical protein RRC34_14150, partial [Lentisphaeria bacterium]|nr:hypothetical protein [Lentisphaeria bacterium]